MVKNKFAVMALTSLALTLNAGVVHAGDDDAMFSMDESFGADSIFEVEDEQAAQKDEKAAETAKDAGAEASVDEGKVAEDAVAEPDVFADMDSSLEEEIAAETTPSSAPAPAKVESVPAAAVKVDNNVAPAPVQEELSPTDNILGGVDSNVLREMAAIERETALLELKAKRERLNAEIETIKANLVRSQLDELERREQITRDRINWELEKEEAAERRALEIEQAKREAERLERAEEERLAREKREAEALERQAEKMEVNGGAPEEDITSLYTIEEVRGVAGDLQAVLQSDNGTINVREGYPLKYGFKVSKVTTSYVEVSRGEEVELLRFASKSSIGN